jgi:hypothetical protein
MNDLSITLVLALLTRSELVMVYSTIMTINNRWHAFLLEFNSPIRHDDLLGAKAKPNTTIERENARTILRLVVTVFVNNALGSQTISV